MPIALTSSSAMEGFGMPAGAELEQCAVAHASAFDKHPHAARLSASLQTSPLEPQLSLSIETAGSSPAAESPHMDRTQQQLDAALDSNEPGDLKAAIHTAVRHLASLDIGARSNLAACEVISTSRAKALT